MPALRALHRGAVHQSPVDAVQGAPPVQRVQSGGGEVVREARHWSSTENARSELTLWRSLWAVDLRAATRTASTGNQPPRVGAIPRGRTCRAVTVRGDQGPVLRAAGFSVHGASTILRRCLASARAVGSGPALGSVLVSPPSATVHRRPPTTHLSNSRTVADVGERWPTLLESVLGATPREFESRILRHGDLRKHR